MVAKRAQKKNNNSAKSRPGEKKPFISQKTREEYKVEGKKLVDKVKQLIADGNVRSLTIKDKNGKTIVIIPLTLGVIGAVLVPPLVVVGAIAAMVTECTISVERDK